MAPFIGQPEGFSSGAPISGLQPGAIDQMLYTRPIAPVLPRTRQRRSSEKA
jgi:hypothetical protein